MEAEIAESAARLRRAMVETQLEARGLSDPLVLDAIGRVPRHRFVTDVPLADAYGDHPIPIGFGRTISQPYIVAAMLERLGLAPGARVLEIGTGSGYQAAVLAEMGAVVDTIEVVPDLHETARARLQDLGYGAVRCHCGDGAEGVPAAAPFDAIVLAAAPAAVPAPLFGQLAIGGRLIAPIGRERQMLEVFTREENAVRRDVLYPVRFVPFVRGK